MATTIKGLRRRAARIISEIDQQLAAIDDWNRTRSKEPIDRDPSGMLAHSREQCEKLLEQLDRIKKGG
jgi:hypothetical protein